MQQLLEANRGLGFLFSPRHAFRCGKELEAVAQLLATSVHFRRSISDSDAVIRETLGWSLITMLENSAVATSQLTDDRIWPIMTAIQIGFYDLLAAMDITASAILCSSSAEFAAAYASGALCSNDAVSLACEWSRAIADGIGTGVMIGIPLGADAAMALATQSPGPTYLACDLTPSMSFVSTTRENLGPMLKILDGHGIEPKLLPFLAGYHSPLIGSWAEYVDRIMPTISLGIPNIPLYSAAAGGRVATLDPQHWTAVIAGPARFQQAAVATLQQGCGTILEINFACHFARLVGDIASHIGRDLTFVEILTIPTTHECLLGGLGLVSCG